MARGTKSRGIAGKRDITPAALQIIPSASVATEAGAGEFSVSWANPPQTYPQGNVDLEYTVNGGAEVLVLDYAKNDVVDSGAAAATIVARVRRNVPTSKGTWGPTDTGTAGA